MTPEPLSADVRTEALRLLSNGVYVLTTSFAGQLHAATVTWVTQVSILPPLLMVALRRNSHLAQAVRKAHRFALNILAADQESLADNFFTHWTGPAEAGTIGGAPFRTSVGNCPLLTDAPAWLECRVASELEAPGDHALLLGEVYGAGVRRAAEPMVLWATPWSYGGLQGGEPGHDRTPPP